MRKVIYLLILPLFLVLNSFGQTLLKEDFINEVYHSFVPQYPVNYYLYEKALNIDCDSAHLNNLRDSLQIYATKKISEELIGKIKKNNKQEKWVFTRLINARSFNDDSTNLISLFHVLEPFKNEGFEGILEGFPDEIKEKIMKEQAALYQADEEQRRRIGGLNYFSKPIISDSYKYAIMSMQQNRGNWYSSVDIFLFERVHKKWKRIASFRC